MNSTHVPWRTWEAVALAGIVGVAAWIRWPHLERPIVGDEEAMLQFNGWDLVWVNSLTTLHPPAYRLSFSAFLDSLTAIEMARSFSLAFALLFIVVVADLSRRMTGSRTAGLLAASWVTFLPVAINFSTLFRPYSLLALLLALHTWSMASWIGDNFRWKYSIPTALTAFLMPHTHYISVLCLAVMGVLLVVSKLLPWRKIWVYLPAALGFAPFGWLILTSEKSKQIRQAGDPFQSLDYVTSMGLIHRGKVDFPSDMTLLLFAVLILVAVHWKRAPTIARISVVGGLSVGAAVLMGSAQHAMKSSTQLLATMFWIPLIVNGPFLLAQWLPKQATVHLCLAALVPAYWIGELTHDRYKRFDIKKQGHHRLKTFVEGWEQYVPEGHDVGFLMPANQRIARLMLINTRHYQTPVSGCGTDKFCFKFSDRYWRKITPDTIPVDQPMAIIWTRHKQTPTLPDHCTVVYEGPDSAGVAHCGVTSP